MVCFVYVVLIKRDRLVPKMEAPKYLAPSARPLDSSLHLRHRGHGASGHVRAHHRLLLRGLRAVEPDLPEGEALLEALRMIALIVAGIAIMGVFDL